MRIANKLLLIAAVSLCVAYVVTAVRSTSTHRLELEALQQETALLHADLKRLEQEKIAAVRELAQAKKSQVEIERLQALTDPNAQAEVTAWLSRVSLLKKKLEQMPAKKIPELGNITDTDWLSVTRSIKLESELDVSSALSSLRSLAKSKGPSSSIQGALHLYMQAHGGQMPSDISKLKPFFENPIDDATLQRHELIYSGKIDDLPRDKILLQEKYIVDDDYDTRLVVMKGGMTRHTVSKNGDAVKQAIQDFSKANAGEKPSNPQELRPFLKIPLDDARLQHYWAKENPVKK